jgi:peptidyl-prolyl cis-trans isomerase A (cyclophilin A)
MSSIHPRFLLAVCVLLVGGCATPVVGPEAASAPSAPPPPAPKELTAPEIFRVNFDTSRGPVVVEVTRAQAPHGADHLFTLVQAHYFDGARFYRVVPGFMVQWGAAADPLVSKTWDGPIPDDPVKGTNSRGTLTFAMQSEPNSRTTHLFINFADNPRLDGLGFAPIGKVVGGMENVDRIYAGDGENPDQNEIREQGNAYLGREFPRLDFIKTARLVP